MRRALVATLILIAVAACTPPPGGSPTTPPSATPSVALTSQAPTASASASTSVPASTPSETDDYPDGGRTLPPGSGATVQIVTYTQTGNYLGGASKSALYTFDNDSAGASECNGSCAETWPPLTVAMGEEPTAGPGMTGTLDTFLRDDGTYEVTYNGAPLYYYSGDSALYDTTGDGFADLWHLARP